MSNFRSTGDGVPQNELSHLGLDLFLDNDSWIDSIREVYRDCVFEVYGDYEILEEASRGGQGIVFKARHLESGNQVALKRLLAGRFSSQENQKRFEREFATVSALRHPGIVRLLKLQVIENDQVLVMEWVEGQHFSHWARACESLDDRLRCFLRVCDAVQYAHEQGVVHRDLKPSNILIQGDGQPVILDFGLAKNQRLVQDSHTAITRSGDTLGTPLYAAPEQWYADEPSDERVDVYSLGVILFEVLTGRNPYQAEHIGKLIQVVDGQQYPRPSQVVQGLSAYLDTIVLSAMERKPGDRYLDVASLADDVRRYLHKQPIMATPPSPWGLLSRLIRRHRLVSLLIASIVMGALAFGTVASIQARRLAHQRSEAETARSLAQESERKARLALEEARERSAESDAMLEFLRKDVLGRSDMGFSRPGVTMKEVLDAAVSNLDGAFSDQPMIAADIRLLFAESYYAVGDFSSAASMCRSVLESDDLDSPSGSYAYLKAMNQLGHALDNLGELEEAESMMRAAHAYSVKHFPRDLAWLCRVKWSLGAHLAISESENGVEAEQLLRESMRINEEGPQSKINALDQLVSLAILVKRLGRINESETLFKQAIQLANENELESSPSLPQAMQALADLYSSKGENANAETMLRQAWALQRSYLGEDHPDALYTEANLGFFLESTTSDDGMTLILDAVEKLRQRDSDPRLASALLQLSELLRARGKLSESLELAEETRKRMGDLYGMQTLGALRALEIIGQIHLEQGDLTKAREALEECFDGFSAISDPTLWMKARVLVDLAACCALEGDNESAEDIALEGTRLLMMAMEGNSRSPQQATIDRLLDVLASSVDPSVAGRAKNVKVRMRLALSHGPSLDVLRVALGYLIGDVPTDHFGGEIVRTLEGSREID